MSDCCSQPFIIDATNNFDNLTPAECQQLFQCIIENGTVEQFTEFLQRLNFSELTTQQITQITQSIDPTQLTQTQINQLRNVLGDIDTFGTVTTATAALTTTNGVAVPVGGFYIEMADGSTWATEEFMAGTATCDSTIEASATGVLLTSNGDTTPEETIDVGAAVTVGFGLTGTVAAGGSYVSLQVGTAPGLSDIFDGAADGFNANDVSSAGGGGGNVAFPAAGTYYWRLVRTGSTNLGSPASNVNFQLGPVTVQVPVCDLIGSNSDRIAVLEAQTDTDTFGGVQTAGAEFTTTNGVAVPVGGQFVEFPNGDTWATLDNDECPAIGGSGQFEPLATNDSSDVVSSFTPPAGINSVADDGAGNIRFTMASGGQTASATTRWDFATPVDIVITNSPSPLQTTVWHTVTGYSVPATEFRTDSTEQWTYTPAGITAPGIDVSTPGVVTGTDAAGVPDDSDWGTVTISGAAFLEMDSLAQERFNITIREPSAIPAGTPCEQIAALYQLGIDGGFDTDTDSFGQVTTSVLALTTTNGVTVTPGEPYIAFPNGDTWAASGGTTAPLPLIVNAGTTPDVTDDSLGTGTVANGETIHFWSDDGQMGFNVSEGSAIVATSTGQTVETGCAQIGGLGTGLGSVRRGTTSVYDLENGAVLDLGAGIIDGSIDTFGILYQTGTVRTATITFPTPVSNVIVRLNDFDGPGEYIENFQADGVAVAPTIGTGAVGPSTVNRYWTTPNNGTGAFIFPGPLTELSFDHNTGGGGARFVDVEADGFLAPAYTYQYPDGSEEIRLRDSDEAIPGPMALCPVEVSQLPPEALTDTFGTVATNNTTDVTTTNGVLVPQGQTYVQFPDGSTWASDSGQQDCTLLDWSTLVDLGPLTPEVNGTLATPASGVDEVLSVPNVGDTASVDVQFVGSGTLPVPATLTIEKISGASTGMTLFATGNLVSDVQGDGVIRVTLDIDTCGAPVPLQMHAISLGASEAITFTDQVIEYAPGATGPARTVPFTGVWANNNGGDWSGFGFAPLNSFTFDKATTNAGATMQFAIGAQPTERTAPVCEFVAENACNVGEAEARIATIETQIAALEEAPETRTVLVDEVCYSTEPVFVPFDGYANGTPLPNAATFNADACFDYEISTQSFDPTTGAVVATNDLTEIRRRGGADFSLRTPGVAENLRRVNTLAFNRPIWVRVGPQVNNNDGFAWETDYVGWDTTGTDWDLTAGSVPGVAAASGKTIRAANGTGFPAIHASTVDWGQAVSYTDQISYTSFNREGFAVEIAIPQTVTARTFRDLDTGTIRRFWSFDGSDVQTEFDGTPLPGWTEKCDSEATNVTVDDFGGSFPADVVSVEDALAYLAENSGGGSVVTAAGSLTTTNGVAVVAGQQYVEFANGDTWAAEAAQSRLAGQAGFTNPDGGAAGSVLTPDAGQISTAGSGFSATFWAPFSSRGGIKPGYIYRAHISGDSPVGQTGTLGVIEVGDPGTVYGSIPVTSLAPFSGEVMFEAVDGSALAFVVASGTNVTVTPGSTVVSFEEIGPV